MLRGILLFHLLAFTLTLAGLIANRDPTNYLRDHPEPYSRGRREYYLQRETHKGCLVLIVLSSCVSLLLSWLLGAAW